MHSSTNCVGSRALSFKRPLKEDRQRGGEWE